MSEKKLWELRLGMFATEAEARRLEEQCRIESAGRNET